MVDPRLIITQFGPAGRIAPAEPNLIDWKNLDKETRAWNGKTWPGS